MSAALRHLFLASLARRRLASALSLLAIALGVALGLAVQVIHGAALDEFGRGMRLLAGAADLQVLGPRGGFDDALYPVLARRPEVADAAPVLEVEGALPGREERLRIFGVDALRTARLQPALNPRADEEAGGEGRLEVLAADALFLSPAARAASRLDPGDRLQVAAGGQEIELRVAGGVPGAGAAQRLAVMDIAAAQVAFGRIGRLSRIDLRLARGVDRETAQARLRPLLPAGVALLAPEVAQTQAAGLSRAYRVNLTMLAVIALLTGGFLVFSAQLLSVVRRRQELAFLRAMGVDRPMLLRGLLAEGAFIGLVGGVFGVALGYGLTVLAFALVGGDLGAGYFEGVEPRVRFDLPATLAYLALGVAAGLAGAWLPAREAARMNTARALRAGDEAEVLQARGRWRAALACLVLAAGLCLLPPLGGVPVFGYAAVALLLAGSVLVLPGAARLAMGVLRSGRTAILRLAHARLSAAPGQVVVAGAGVVASVALATAMAIMVSSFRASVDDWLTQVLPADLYLRDASGSTGFLPPEVLARVAAVPGVAELRPVRFDTLRLTGEHWPVTLIARPVENGARLPLVAGEGGDDRQDARKGGAGEVNAAEARPAWISEAMADLFRLAVGDPLVLPLDGRPHRFRVAGIWRDYARQHGAVVIELADYRRLTGDMHASDVGIHLAPGAGAEAVMRAVRAELGGHPVEIETPGEIRRITLEIFDRTFLVTYLMEAVAVLIGLFGISTSFAALATARRKEFGVLRHLGLTRTEIGRLLGLEGALSAAVGVAVGMGAGGAIAVVLVEVINRQSFHWSMEMHLPAAGLVAFGLALVALAALAARLSGYQAMRQSAVLAVREDW